MENENVRPDYLSIVQREIELSVRAKLIATFGDSAKESLAAIVGVKEWEHGEILQEAAVNYLLGESLGTTRMHVKEAIRAKKEAAEAEVAGCESRSGGV